MSVRRTLLGHAWAQTVLWVLLAVVVNHASSAAFLRADLTDDKVYTLSPAARAEMGKLEKPMVARVYFTPGLEAPYNNHLQAVREKLEELRAYSNGRLEVQVIDPTEADKAEEAQRFGVNPIQYRYQSSDRAEVKQVFMGVSLSYGDRQEIVDPITRLETLEYELVRAVHALVTPSDDRKTVALLQGNGEPDLSKFPPENPMGQLRDRLAQQYDLQPVTLGGDLGVPEEVDVVVVIGPQQPLDDRALYQLDQFLMRGGSLALFVSSLKPDWESMRPIEVRHAMDAWLGSYGVKLGKDAILDRKYNEVMRVPVQSGRRRSMVPVNYALIPIAPELAPDSPITRGLNRAVSPFSTTVELADPLPQGVEGKVLIRTSENSTAIPGLRTVNPTAFQEVSKAEKPGPFGIAVSLTGKFHSFFADSEIPRPPAGADGSVARDDPDSKIVDGEEARLVVVGSADFVANNVPFVMNTVDWLVQDAALVSIRSRGTEVDTFDPPESGDAWKWKLAIPVAPLLLLLAGGAAVWLLPRRRAA